MSSASWKCVHVVTIDCSEIAFECIYIEVRRCKTIGTDEGIDTVIAK